jgi:hypothetical protein
MTMRLNPPWIRHVTGALTAFALALCALSAGAQPTQPAGPFEQLAGSWAGTGTVTIAASGGKERIRCRIEYQVGRNGNGVHQELRCASDSYKFELSADVEYSGGSISGRWTERSRSVGGTISGSARPGWIEVLTESTGFSALLTIQTRGDRQSVQIESLGTELSKIDITLRRTGH